MRLVVTGASGFIGRPLAQLLASDGHEVTALIGRNAPPCGVARSIRVDFAQPLPSDVCGAVAEAEAVAHLAAVRKDWGLSPEVAARVAWAGAGVNLRTGRPRPRAVLAAWRRVSSDASYRANAQRIARSLAAHDGPREVVEHTMTLLSRR